MKSLFSSGYRGLSDSIFSGVRGSVYRSVGIDHRSKPGVLKAHQKLVKHSGTTIDELCKVSVNVSDGSKLWFSSESNKIWREVSGTYTLVSELETEAFDVLTAQLTNSADISAQSSGQAGATIKPDGTKLFTVDINAGDKILEYTLGTANDITTISYVDAKDINAQTINATALYVRADGLKMYVGSSTDTTIYQYTLSTAWDVSTATYDSVSFNFQTAFSDISFNSDGTKIYLLIGEKLTAVTLTTAWDVSTAQLIDFLVIAGGGGGGRAATDDGAGGGGAGGYIETSTVALTGSYPVVIGGGGAGATSAGEGSNGENSSIFSKTALGGGGGGGATSEDGGNGGSGGGGSNAGNGGNGLSGQGNDGGGGSTSSDAGGGGGGAGGSGQTATGTAGDGGTGITSSISGTSVCRAGGGGGGFGSNSTPATGTCGGGSGGTGVPTTIAPTAGTANTGGGGGGGGDNNNGASGGSGVVIISYPTGSMTATGGTVTTSGGNTIHTFTADGTFQITDNSDLEIGSSTGSITFSSDGTSLYTADTAGSNSYVYQYTLSTAWDITTAELSFVMFTGQNNSAITFDSSGLNLYSLGTDETIRQYTIVPITNTPNIEAIQYKKAEFLDPETQSQHIVWAVNDYIFEIRVEDITSDWVPNTRLVGKFENGDNAFHAMVEQNDTLYIADANILASVSRQSVFVAQTIFNLPEGENITSITDFDIDVLIGTKQLSTGRVLRWDGFSINVTSDDDIYVEGGVQAFLSDDNYRYVLDKEGTIWFYNGEQCEVVYRIPEVGDGKVKINPNAVGYWRRVPVFGVSNDTGNTVLQGIYGLGKYSRGYDTTLSLDFPVPSSEFSGVEIGSIIVDGQDLYTSWKDEEDVGVAKLDYTAKYEGAYMETMALSEAGERHQLKTLSDVIVPYYSKPASTDITIGVDKNYNGTFDDMTVLEDTKRKLVELKTPSVVDVANPRLRVGFTVNGNDSMEIEDVLYSIAPLGKK